MAVPWIFLTLKTLFLGKELARRKKVEGDLNCYFFILTTVESKGARRVRR
jgi:hypothetical protein